MHAHMYIQSGVKYMYIQCIRVCVFKSLQLNKKKLSKYDQEIAQSHTADQPTAA